MSPPHGRTVAAPASGPPQAARVRITSGTGPTAQGRRCYIAVMAQMLNQKTEGYLLRQFKCALDFFLQIKQRKRMVG